MEAPEKVNSKKETIAIVSGMIALVIAILIFSGIFADSENGFKILDFSNLVGSFGKISEGDTFRGSGGSSVREGFLFAVSLAPAIMLAMGLIEVFERYGALKMAERLLSPVLKPLLGVPGKVSLSLVAGLNSADAGPALTRDLYDQGEITADERDILAAFMYAFPGIIINYFSGGAALLSVITVATGVPLLYLFAMKFVQANIIRVLIKLDNKMAAKKVAK